MNLQNILKDKFVPFAGKIAANKYLKAVSDGFMSITPVIIVGSIFSLLNSLAIKPYQNFIDSTGLKSFLSIPNKITNDIIAIYAVFFIAYNLAKYYEKDSGTAGMIALFTFLAITPINNTANIISNFLSDNKIEIAKDITIPNANVLPYEWIGAK